MLRQRVHSLSLLRIVIFTGAPLLPWSNTHAKVLALGREYRIRLDLAGSTYAESESVGKSPKSLRCMDFTGKLFSWILGQARSAPDGGWPPNDPAVDGPSEVHEEALCYSIGRGFSPSPASRQAGITCCITMCLGVSGLPLLRAGALGSERPSVVRLIYNRYRQIGPTRS